MHNVWTHIMIHHFIVNINLIYIALTICIHIHTMYTGNVGKQDVTLLLQQINRIAITFLKSIDNTTTHNINTHITHTVHNTTTASTPTNNSTSDNNEHDNMQHIINNNDSNKYSNKHSNSIIICEEPETEIIISSARSENEHFYKPIPIDTHNSTTTNNTATNNNDTNTNNTNNTVQIYDYNKVYELIKQNDTFKILKNTI